MVRRGGVLLEQRRQRVEGHDEAEHGGVERRGGEAVVGEAEVQAADVEEAQVETVARAYLGAPAAGEGVSHCEEGGVTPL